MPRSPWQDGRHTTPTSTAPTEDDMAFDEDLAHRIRAVLGALDVQATEQRMFGGLAVMVRGHMTVGVMGDELLVRVGKEGHDDALRRPHTREFDFTGRPMTSMVVVTRPGLSSDDDLAAWVRRGLDFTATLPAK